MPFTSIPAPWTGSEYTMNRPSGDHNGCVEMPSVSGVGEPPDAAILKIRVDFPTELPANTIHWPSGDHEKDPRISTALVNRRMSVPFALIAESAARPCVR